MGKLSVSHLVIHDNLKLPITRKSVLRLFKSKTCTSIVSPSNDFGATTSSDVSRERSSTDLSNVDVFKELRMSQTLSDDSGIHMAAIKEEIEDNYPIKNSKDTSQRIRKRSVFDNEEYGFCRLAIQEDFDEGINVLDKAGAGAGAGTYDSKKYDGIEINCGGSKVANNPNGLRNGVAAECSGLVNGEIKIFENQVAGHMFNKSKSIGMLKSDNGTVLKPITKKECGEREIEFYERLYDTVDTHLIELRDLVPKYFGTKNITFNDIEYKCLILEDLTRDFKEPCVIDIKIGKRTWDPMASKDKILREERKYNDCKRDLGFCIPGFQVYNIKEHCFQRFGRDYGRSLDKNSTYDALKLFLNADSDGFCRDLLLQILGTLWRIQLWARKQNRLNIYASSVLIVYDAKRLRECINLKKNPMPKLKLTRSKSLYRPLSLAVLNNDTERVPTGFSGQLTKEGPILHTTRSFPSKIKELAMPLMRNRNNTWKKSMNVLKRTHSFQNDYDKEVQDRKQDYTSMLDELMSDLKPELWVTVKMIDFAHVFPGTNCDIDKNYLDGINNLVKVFEEFLAESE